LVKLLSNQASLAKLSESELLDKSISSNLPAVDIPHAVLDKVLPYRFRPIPPIRDHRYTGTGG
jgi:hypothetical protein